MNEVQTKICLILNLKIKINLNLKIIFAPTIPYLSWILRKVSKFSHELVLSVTSFKWVPVCKSNLMA